MIPYGHTKLLQVLAAHNVPVVVIGGHAVNFHGFIRGTEDLDLIWMRTPLSESALAEALREINAQWISDEIDVATRIEKLVPVTASYVAGHHLMVLVTDFGFLDLFDFVPGWQEANVQELFDTAVEVAGVRYVSLDWLRKMKERAGRTRDIEDLENLQ